MISLSISGINEDSFSIVDYLSVTNVKWPLSQDEYTLVVLFANSAIVGAISSTINISDREYNYLSLMVAQVSFLDRLINNRILIHIVFWLIMSLTFYVFFSWFIYESFEIYLANLIAILPPQIILSYFIIYFLIPEYLNKKKYITFALLLILSIYLMSCLARFLTIYVVEEITSRGYPKDSIFDILTQVNHLISRYFFVVIIAPMIIVPIKIIKDHLDEKQHLEAIKKEKANAELNFLKAQIHPHFLFNTLNNLYALALEKSDQTPEVVMKLSELLDYMLYQCNDPRVSLTKEIELIKNYIELEKIRYGDRLIIDMNENIMNPDAQIAPLLLITLIENAFKHGVSTDPGSPKVKIDIREEDNQLTVTVVNTRSGIEEENGESYKEGIGLKNLKSQLDLQYKDKFILEIKDNEADFKVVLKIQL